MGFRAGHNGRGGGCLSLFLNILKDTKAVGDFMLRSGVIGSSFTHMSGASAGMTQRLGSLHMAFECGLSSSSV